MRLIFHKKFVEQASVCMLVLLCLSGCRAMDTRDLDGTKYNNEQQRFYSPEKNAKVTNFSHAYRWKSGELEGYCSEETSRRNHSRDDEQGGRASVVTSLVVDNIVLTNTTLFETSSSNLSETGRKSLKQLTDRISSYEEIQHIELEGHTDSRGDITYNQNLSEARADSVRSFVTNTLGLQVPIKSTGVGELKPVSSNSSQAGMQKNRRVEAKVVAMRVRADNKDSTLCHPTPKHISSSTPMQLANGTQFTDSDEQWQLEQYKGHLPLSVGDHLRLNVAGDDSFNGIYEVTIGGGIDLPLLGYTPVHGLTVPAVKKAIGDQLVERQLIRAHAVAVDASVLQWAQIEVFVRGAVFSPGRVHINFRKAEDKVFNNSRNSGDFATDRMLSTALSQAGGIRPDAELAQIQVLRGGKLIRVDLSGLMSGTLARDLPLISGDEIIVPSTGYFQGALVRPTEITPPGIRVFMSNSTVPVFNNSSANIEKDTFSIPYGTRLLRGLVASNCVGGTQHTNASRRGVLISTNPITGSTEVVERSIQQLISDPDRDDINPHLMPNDGLACYDSDVSNLRDVARTLSDILAPFVDVSNILQNR